MKNILPAIVFTLFATITQAQVADKLFSKRDGYANYAKIELAKGDRESIAAQLKLTYDAASKNFFFSDDSDHTYPMEVSIDVIDFNHDRNAEVFVNVYNYHYHGQIGDETVFFKNIGGKYQPVLSEHGSVMLLTTSNKGYPDLLVGGPGLKAPGFRWNGVKYVFYKTYPFAENNAPAFLNMKTLK